MFARAPITSGGCRGWRAAANKAGFAFRMQRVVRRPGASLQKGQRVGGLDRLAILHPWGPAVDQPISRRDWIKTGAAGLAAAALTPTASTPAVPPDHSSFSFHHDHVLGTSLDLWLLAPDMATAERAEAVALAEVERLRQVFSLYDPDSELSRLNRTAGSVAASADLRAVLRRYERWQAVSAWACNPQVGALAALWAVAERTGFVPDRAALAALADAIRRPGWRIDDAAGTVTRTSPHPLDLNAGAKGYILGRAADAVRAAVPAVAGGLVNLGGDLVGWGARAWPLGVQDPAAPAENAEPLGGLWLTDGAVATSGGYQRFFTVRSLRYSHLLDPRTGQPANDIASATVVAPDSVTANLLATTLCVLGTDEGLRLTATVPGAECLVITTAGRRVTSPGLRLTAVARAGGRRQAAENKATSDPWPDGFQVSVALEVPNVGGGGRYRRPYVAVWVEDADGKAVRTLAVWGNASRWLPELTDWWKIGRGDAALVRAVTRATRGPGKYELAWDGKDDKGTALGQGTYTIKVEVSREHGGHVRQLAKIDCKAEAVTVKMAKNVEAGETTVEYGKKTQP
jgi:thiamine biosynthesis lipoprotein ApbE